MPRLIVVPVGKVVHVFLVGAPAVKAAAFTEFRYKISCAGGGNCTAILQSVSCCHYLDNFGVLSLKYVFWSAVKKRMLES